MTDRTRKPPLQPDGSHPRRGRPPTAAAVQAIKRITSETVARQIQAVAEMSVSELEAFLARREIPAMAAVFGKIVLEALKTGDATRASFLLERTVGKVKERVEVSTPKPFIAQYRDGTREVMGVEQAPAAEVDGEVDGEAEGGA